MLYSRKPVYFNETSIDRRISKGAREGNAVMMPRTWTLMKE